MQTTIYSRDIMTIFADRLEELRISCGETQENMARVLTCTEAHYQRLEDGKVIPNAIVINKVADHFGVSADYLLGRKDERN